MRNSFSKYLFIYASKLIVRYWVSVNLNKFLESFNLMLCFLIASRKNCSNSSYSVVYDWVISSFRLIHTFSRAKNVSMRLKSDEYEDKRVKITSTVSHIWMRSSFRWIQALFRIKIDLHVNIELADKKQANQAIFSSHLRSSSIVKVHCESIWFCTKSLKMIAVMLFWWMFQAI